MDVSNIIAILALLLVAYSVFDGKRSSKAAIELIHREIELAKIQLSKAAIEVEADKKADVSARIFQEGKNSRVRVFNRGPSEARNVQLVLGEHNSIVTLQSFSGKLPMERMENGQSVDGHAHVHLSSPRKEKLTIQWDDDSSANRRTIVELTI